jgi:hypothetical protein
MARRFCEELSNVRALAAAAAASFLLPLKRRFKVRDGVFICVENSRGACLACAVQKYPHLKSPSEILSIRPCRSLRL